MLDLTFGEQVKIILSRKGMTIKELAEIIEERTEKKMSRQNLTQRLGRDNFQEQDMRRIADILGCPFSLDILGNEDATEKASRYTRESRNAEVALTKQQPAIKIEEVLQKKTEFAASERDITIGELVEIHEELDALIEGGGELPPPEQPVEELLEEMAALEAEEAGRIHNYKKPEAEDKKSPGWMNYLQRRKKQPDSIDEPTSGDADHEVPENDAAEQNIATQAGAAEVYDADMDNREEMSSEYEEDYDENSRTGDVNPYTGKEYQSNSVRMHPSRIGYVQVYDRDEHEWTDMTEWAFLGYQERKKALLGKDYEPPIYLD